MTVEERIEEIYAKRRELERSRYAEWFDGVSRKLDGRLSHGESLIRTAFYAGYRAGRRDEADESEKAAELFDGGET